MSHSDHDHGHAHFDEVATTWDDDPAKVERAHATAALLRDTLDLRGTERVLEIGGGTGQLSLALAFLAGVVSFISPCVLALVPVYVAYLGETAADAALGCRAIRRS